jgi:hypothetical protein
MLAEMDGRGVLQPDGAIEAFDLVLDALRELFVQEHRKRSSYAHLATHISEPALLSLFARSLKPLCMYIYYPVPPGILHSLPTMHATV